MRPRIFQKHRFSSRIYSEIPLRQRVVCVCVCGVVIVLKVYERNAFKFNVLYEIDSDDKRTGGEQRKAGEWNKQGELCYAKREQVPRMKTR